MAPLAKVIFGNFLYYLNGDLICTTVENAEIAIISLQQVAQSLTDVKTTEFKFHLPWEQKNLGDLNVTNIFEFELSSLNKCNSS